MTDSARIIRVFPRQTRATPDDELVRFGPPGLFPDDEADEVHVSVAFTWDLPKAERLAKEWRHVAPVKIGGPATGEPGGEFVPGMYLKRGYTITSRGCPNRCWFCSVWRREGATVRELPITEGWNILDDNLLACSEDHIIDVFRMLAGQGHPAEFTGGLEAARLTPLIAAMLRAWNPRQVFFAYDTPDDLKSLREAGKLLRATGFSTTTHVLRAYVLCGYPHDTVPAAERRMHQTLDAGFCPMAMLWRGDDGNTTRTWRQFQRLWARPAIVYARARQ